MLKRSTAVLIVGSAIVTLVAASMLVHRAAQAREKDIRAV